MADASRQDDKIRSDVRVSLVLRDFAGEPGAITNQLGLTPSFAGKKGDRRMTASGRVMADLNEHSHWVLASGLPRTASLEEHARALLLSVGDAVPRVAAISTPVKQIYCTVIPDGPVPLLSLEKKTIEQIAATGCDIVIDVIHVDDDDET